MGSAIHNLLERLLTETVGQHVEVVAGEEFCRTFCAQASVTFLRGGERALLFSMDTGLLASLAAASLGWSPAMLRKHGAEDAGTLQERMELVLRALLPVLTPRGRGVAEQMTLEPATSERACAAFVSMAHAQRRFFVSLRDFPSGECSLFTAV